MWKKVKKILRYVMIFGMLSIIAMLFVWSFYLTHRIIKGKEACFKACPGAEYKQAGNLKFPVNFKYLSKTNGVIKCMCFPNYKIVNVTLEDK